MSFPVPAPGASFQPPAGGLPPGDPRLIGLMQNASAVVVPSLSETFGLIIIEAWGAGAAVLSRVDRVVYGAVDPKAGAVGSLWDVVRDRRLNHRPEVVSGVLAAESTALLEEFFAGHR